MVADSERGHPGPIEWLVVLWSCGEHGEVDVFTIFSPLFPLLCQTICLSNSKLIWMPYSHMKGGLKQVLFPTAI